MRLDGKHCAITGGGGEIGLSIAEELAAAGASVTLVDKLFSDAARDVARGIDARLCEVDVTADAEVEKAMSALPEVDVAVANAGVHRGGRFLDLDPNALRLMLEVNLVGAFVFCQSVARRMVARGRGGSIVITGSWVQDIPNVDNTGYCASKAGVAMMARCMALELGQHRIRVNNVAPGIVNAGMAKRQIQVDPAFARKAAGAIPLGELQEAHQIAKAVAFVCSGDAEAITGTTLLVDGGLSLFKYE